MMVRPYKLHPQFTGRNYSSLQVCKEHVIFIIIKLANCKHNPTFNKLYNQRNQVYDHSLPTKRPTPPFQFTPLFSLVRKIRIIESCSFPSFLFSAFFFFPSLLFLRTPQIIMTNPSFPFITKVEKCKSIVFLKSC